MAKLEPFGIAQQEAQSRLEHRLIKEAPLAKQPQPTPVSKKNEHPGRAGKKPAVAHIPESAHKSLKRFALDHDTTVEKLIITALDRLLMDMGQDWTIGTGDEFVVPTDAPKSQRR